MTHVSINKIIFKSRYLFITGEGTVNYRASLKIPKVHKQRIWYNSILQSKSKNVVVVLDFFDFSLNVTVFYRH